MVVECCSSEWLSEKLVSSDDGLLLLDCRLVDEYRASHVQGSIHVSVPSIMMRRLKVGSVAVATIVGSHDRQRFTERWKSGSVVLYDGEGEGGGEEKEGGSAIESENTGSATDQKKQMTSPRNDVVSMLMNRLRNDGCRVYYLRDGFSGFHRKYTHLCVGDDPQVKDRVTEANHVLCLGLTKLRLADTSDEESNRKEGRGTPGSAFPFPVQVMPYLFLGNAENSADLACLNRHGIRYILNVTADIPNTFEKDGSFKYLQIPITDNLSQNLNAFFPQAIAFIDEARSKSCGVLVHCLAGISRSVTVTVAYLMFTLSLSLNDAYDHLRQCKPNISPNFNFMGQLLDFEMILQQRLRCSCCSTIPTAAGDSAEVKMTPPCETCRNTKTYFSSPTLPIDQSQTTEGHVTSPVVLPTRLTSAPGSLVTSSPASSSTMSLSSMTSDSGDSA